MVLIHLHMNKKKKSPFNKNDVATIKNKILTKTLLLGPAK